MARVGFAAGHEEFLDRVVAPGRGFVPDLFRALAVNEELTAAWAGLGDAVRDHALEPRRRELVILLVARLLDSKYEWTHHQRVGAAVGVTATEIADLEAWPAHRGWSAVERAMLTVVAAVVTRAELPEPSVAEVREQWGDKAFVEICVTGAYYLSVAHLVAALGVEPEPAPSGGGSADRH